MNDVYGPAGMSLGLHAIVDRMAVENCPNVYMVGCQAKRVTIYSQQCRALNLVHSLLEWGKLVGSSDVAVVGGGIAGITAACAALIKGCTVTILEARDELLSVQRQSLERYVHPFIYDWPRGDWNEERAGLPLCDWSAETPERVAQQILHGENGWDAISQKYQERLNILMRYRVASIVQRGDKAAVHAKGKTDHHRLYDCVIVAVGPGREVVSADAHPYWENDGLGKEQDCKNPREYLISGVGDGGLIDTLRLRFRNFDHSQHARLFAGNEWKPVLAELLNIEREVEEMAARGEHYDIRERYSYYLSRMLVQNPRMLEPLLASLRHDTHVYLNAKESSPLTLNASILNRFSVFLLLEHLGGVHFEPGEIIDVQKTEAGRWRVQIQNRPESIEVARVIKRHGPSSATKDIPNLKPKMTPKPPWVEDDPTRFPFWPPGFFGPEKRPSHLLALHDATSHGSFSGRVDRPFSPSETSQKPPSGEELELRPNSLIRRVAPTERPMRRYLQWLLSRAGRLIIQAPFIRITLAGVIIAIVNLCALFVVPISTVLVATQRDLSSVNSWSVSSFQATPVILAGLYLYLSRMLSRRTGLDLEQKTRWKYRKSLSSRIVGAWSSSPPLDRVDQIRQDLLECITVVAAEILGQPSGSLASNLTVFENEDLNSTVSLTTSIRASAAARHYENDDDKSERTRCVPTNAYRDASAPTDG